MRNIWQTSAAASQGIPGFRGRINKWILDGTTSLNTASRTSQALPISSMRMVPVKCSLEPNPYQKQVKTGYGNSTARDGVPSIAQLPGS